MIVGEGRLLAHLQLGISKISALVKKVPDKELAGRFLTENIIRKKLPWAELASLVKIDFDAGLSGVEIAALYSISEGYASRLRSILDHTAHGLEDDVAELSVDDAKAFTLLKAEDQHTVMTIFKETTERQLKSLVERAQSIRQETGQLSYTDLKTSLHRVEIDLKGNKERLKVLRVHDMIGPANVATLLKNAAFRKQLEKAGVNLNRWDALK